jgi:hypothetical protein
MGMADDLEGRIDALYAMPLERFTPERDALAGELRAAGDHEAAGRVKALRKPVVSAWALNALARADPDGVAELDELGRRLRDAQRRAVSGGDAEPLRAATEERRRLVARLAASAVELLGRQGAAGSAHDDIASTLDAAAVDERAAAELRSGRLTRPLRPPTGFGDAPALTVVPGGRKASEPEPADEDERTRTRLLRDLRRELAAAETRARRGDEAIARAREQLERAEQRRQEARERVREAEAARRGLALELKRLAAALSKLERQA